MKKARRVAPGDLPEVSDHWGGLIQDRTSGPRDEALVARAVQQAY